MKLKYKVGDKVILTTNKIKMDKSCLPYRLLGKTITIHSLMTDRYRFIDIDEEESSNLWVLECSIKGYDIITNWRERL